MTTTLLLTWAVLTGVGLYLLTCPKFKETKHE